LEIPFLFEWFNDKESNLLWCLVWGEGTAELDQQVLDTFDFHGASLAHMVRYVLNGNQNK